MLVAFPVAFYTAAMVCFISYSVTANDFYFRVAVLANGAGVATAVLAALLGFIDWLNIPAGKPAKKTGLQHMLVNVAALLLFAVNLVIQCPDWNTAAPKAQYAILLTGLGFVITLVAGFLGWTLVQKHHAGIDLTTEQLRIEPDQLPGSSNLKS
jgi:uncharacterized membrane protein